MHWIRSTLNTNYFFTFSYSENLKCFYGPLNVEKSFNNCSWVIEGIFTSNITCKIFLISNFLPTKMYAHLHVCTYTYNMYTKNCRKFYPISEHCVCALTILDFFLKVVGRSCLSILLKIKTFKGCFCFFKES